MAIEDLEGVKRELYKAFNEAVARHAKYEDRDASATNTPFNPKTQNRIAIGALAQGIAAVEEELREIREFSLRRLEK